VRARSRPITVKWGLTGIGLIWVVWAGWDQFANIPASEIENHASPIVQERMRDCSGTFKQRYECKETIVIRSGRDTFVNMLARIAIVTVPPALLAAGYHLMTRRRSDDDEYDDGGGAPAQAQPPQHHRRYHRRTSHH
jgi:hypothetical protein